ncbi:MAG: class A beta-lactamase [Hyphomicrobium sp.]|nr:class A beta-lactamase [Hyphomicrobium sp.]
MPAPITRRFVLSSALAIAALHVTEAGAEPSPVDITARLAEIEASAQGRLGVVVLDTRTGDRYGLREDERFPLCSTFKLLAAALVLTRVDGGEEKLDRRVVFSAPDIVEHSPATKDRAGPAGMTMEELCAAAITQSDNTAANLMLASFGGPAALTNWLRTLGDKATRLDRIEPDLNEAAPGDPRDGTTPRAMAYTLQRILLGNVLSKASESLLIGWLTANTTGDARLRAGMPAGWRVGDKTGTGSNGATSDVAIVWPPERPPVIIAAYLVDTKAPLEERNRALADVGRAAAALF